MGQLGYMKCIHFYYFMSRHTFENGLRELKADADIVDMLACMRGTDTV